MDHSADWKGTLLALRAECERHFAFLTERGFALGDKGLSHTHGARYDGWHLMYKSPLVTVRIDYYEMELVIWFSRGGTEASYLEIDRALFGGASGFAGCMFNAGELTPVIARIATDIRENYSGILRGAKNEWDRVVEALKLTPDKGREAEREEARSMNQHARAAAEAAFREERFADVVRLLEPHIASLTNAEKAKVEFARKKARRRLTN